jgi:CRP/FNR family cyclic AMP-dependent transcriptional regulator
MMNSLADLAQFGTLRQYRQGALILNEGEAGDALYVLLKGSVRTFAISPHGKELTYETITEGHYFGEMALDGGVRSASVEAITDCTCAVVPNAQVMAFGQQHPDFAVHLLHAVIGRARRATQAARDMALLDVYPRLAQALNRDFLLQDGKSTQTHARLAAQIGASRDMVSKLIKDLVRGQYLSLDQRVIVQLKKLPTKW